MTFRELSTFFQRIEDTPSRLLMTEVLSSLFQNVSEKEIGPICYLLQGRVSPLYEPIEFGLADKFMIRAISLAFGDTQETVLTAFNKYGDLGTVVEKLHPSKKPDRDLSFAEVFSDLTFIAHCTGTGSQEIKIQKLSALMRKLDALSARYVVRIPLDKLRLGFSDMTILDALSWMLTGNKSKRPLLEDAYNVRPDIGYIATQVKLHGIAGVSHVRSVVGVPIFAALCQRIPTAEEMVEKMGEVAVEPKYDGVRCQIHWKRKTSTEKGFVRSFSRNLEDTTQMYPELLGLDEELTGAEVVLDSEAVGFDPVTGAILPFQDTTTRKRKYEIELFSSQVPLRFYVFDILYKDGESLLEVPLSKRRAILEKTIKGKTTLAISPQIVTDSSQTLRAYHHTQIKNGLEGVVIKKWNSPYEPGRKGFSWVKFKEEEGKTGKLTDTIDAVVMGFYRGEGKRSGFGIGAFLVGVKQGESIVTITKIGTGVSDDLWKELKIKFDHLKTKTKPKEYEKVAEALVPDYWITPSIVVEVAGDDLTKSPNHGAGIALRFPRLVKIREDKGPHEATTVEEVTRMYESQGSMNTKHT